MVNSNWSSQLKTLQIPPANHEISKNHEFLTTFSHQLNLIKGFNPNLIKKIMDIQVWITSTCNIETKKIPPTPPHHLYQPHLHQPHPHQPNHQPDPHLPSSSSSFLTSAFLAGMGSIV